MMDGYRHQWEGLKAGTTIQGSISKYFIVVEREGEGGGSQGGCASSDF